MILPETGVEQTVQITERLLKSARDEVLEVKPETAVNVTRSLLHCRLNCLRLCQTSIRLTQQLLGV